LDLDTALLRKAKERAARTSRPLKAVVEDALRETLSRTPRQRSRHIDLPVSTCKIGLMPGVDLDSAAALLDLMEQDDGAR
jgi:hypothetical protein